MERERINLIYRGSRALCRAVCWLYLGHRARGVQRIPRSGAYLLAVNHASFLDPILAGIWLRRPLRFLARSSLFRPAPWGWYLRRLGAVPLEREGSSLSALRKARELLAAGSGVLIFPEGTRTRDGELGELKAGVVALARDEGAPIVPTWIEGSGRAFGRKHRFPRPRRTSVHYGEPFRVDPGARPEDAVVELRRRLLELKEDAERERSGGSAPAKVSERGRTVRP